MEFIAYVYDGDVIVRLTRGEYIKILNSSANAEQKGGEYGERVRAARLQMRLTQAELANDLEISRNYLSQIERGKARNLSAKITQSIEFICGVRP